MQRARPTSHSPALLLTALGAAARQWVRDHFAYNFDAGRGRVSTRIFTGGRTNIAFNCLDRHVEAGRGSQPCFLWEVLSFLLLSHLLGSGQSRGCVGCGTRLFSRNAQRVQNMFHAVASNAWALIEIYLNLWALEIGSNAGAPSTERHGVVRRGTTSGKSAP